MSQAEPGLEGRGASVSLVVGFGAIGLVGGWLTADAFEFAISRLAVRGLITGVTPITAALLGAFLASRIVGAEGAKGAGTWLQRGPLAMSLLVLGSIMLAGAANGATLALLLATPLATPFGAIFGVFASLPFVPALGLVVLAATRVGRARAGSIVAASDRRAVWGATATAIALGVLGMRALCQPPMTPALSLIVAGIAGAALVGLFAVDAVALMRVVKMAEVGEVQEGDGERATGARDGAADGVDLGVGEEVRVEVVRPKHAYRGVEQIARVVRGSREGAVAALRGGLARAGIALAMIGTVLWAQPWG